MPKSLSAASVHTHLSAILQPGHHKVYHIVRTFLKNKSKRNPATKTETDQEVQRINKNRELSETKQFSETRQFSQTQMDTRRSSYSAFKNFGPGWKLGNF